MTTADDVRQAAGFATRSPELQVQCPHCRAPAGEHCHGRTGRGPQRREPHPARVLSAAEPRAVVIPFPVRPPPRSP